MSRFTERTALLLGEDAVKTLRGKKVAIFGIGGVGGYTAESLVRSGIGALDIIDADKVSESNINRQIIALSSTVGKFKTECFKLRALDINPDVKITTHNVFFSPENADEFDFSKYDYVVDAVDTVSAKLEIIARAKSVGTNVISAMGAGNKLDATRFKVADISKTHTCPLAKVMRYELRKRGIKGVKVVFSDEEPKKYEGERLLGSVSFVPSVMGLIIAGEVIRDLIK